MKYEGGKKDKGGLSKRVGFGLLVGLACGGATIAGTWPFAVLMAILVYLSSLEYFGFVSSKVISTALAIVCT